MFPSCLGAKKKEWEWKTEGKMALVHFSRSQNWESRSSVLLWSENQTEKLATEANLRLKYVSLPLWRAIAKGQNSRNNQREQ